MRERLEMVLDEFSAYLWDQFQQDLEFSHRCIDVIEKAWGSFNAWLRPRE
jgi:hypothetical protein